MSQMRILRADVEPFGTQTVIKYESPDGMGTRETTYWSGANRLTCKGYIQSGDGKISYWLNKELQRQLLEASTRLCSENLQNTFLKLVFRKDTFLPLDHLIQWEDHGHPEWLVEELPDTDWQLLVDSGYIPEYGKAHLNKECISVVLVWWTNGAFLRGEPAHVYHPTKHGMYTEALESWRGGLHPIGESDAPRDVSLSVIRAVT